MSAENLATGYDWAPSMAQGDHTHNPQILDAFREVRRIHFLPPGVRHREAEDQPLPIGHGQMNSQPRTVALMLDLLDSQEGDRVMDVGAGSGWTTALLAHIVGTQGEVHGTERLSTLVNMARANLNPYDYPHAAVHHTPRQIGLPRLAPYDRILVSAFAKEEWLGRLTSQLSPEGGVLVAPLAKRSTPGEPTGHDKTLTAVRRDGRNITVLREVGGYSFVPLVNKIPGPIRVTTDAVRSIMTSLR